MIILEKLKSACFYVATLFGIGKLRFGGIIASFFALPLVLLAKILYDYFPVIFFWLYLAIFLISYLAIFVATKCSTEENRSSIVLNKVLGVFVAFIMVPLKWKLILVGFSFFHILSISIPFLFFRVFNRKVDSLPSNLWILFSDLSYGIICNLFLQLVYWIAL